LNHHQNQYARERSQRMVDMRSRLVSVHKWPFPAIPRLLRDRSA
jgi:hypothetical protein